MIGTEDEGAPFTRGEGICVDVDDNDVMSVVDVVEVCVGGVDGVDGVDGGKIVEMDTEGNDWGGAAVVLLFENACSSNLSW